MEIPFTPKATHGRMTYALGMQFAAQRSQQGMRKKSTVYISPLRHQARSGGNNKSSISLAPIL